MKLTDYADVVRERWRYILAGILAGLLVAGIASFLTPVRYASESLLYVSAQAQPDNAQSAYQGSLLSEQRVRSYAQLLSSDRVAREVQRQLSLDLPLEDIRNDLRATYEVESVLMTVSAQGRSPAEAVQIGDAASAALSQIVNELERSPLPNRPPTVTLRIVQPAVALPDIVQPNLIFNFALGVIGGLVVGFVLALVRSLTDVSVRSSETLEGVAEAPNLGSVVAKNVAGPGRDEGARRFEESLRHVRANLEFVGVDRKRRVLAVTSAMAGEGKTTITCELARVIAAAGSRTVVVDGDLRRPRAHEVFGLEGTVGLSNVLKGQISLDEGIQQVTPSLALLASGKVPPNPSELLGSERMSELVDTLGSRYEVVLIDLPPVLPVADVLEATKYCDGMVLVCRYGKTTRQQVGMAARSLTASGTPLVGVVLNMLPDAKSSSYGAYSSYLTPGAPSAESELAVTEEVAYTGHARARMQRPSPRKRL